MGTGIASSASAFASLALAAASAAGLALSERELSRLARRGSGSACRSIPGGFVEWLPGNGDEDSFAFSLAPADHWRLVDCLAIVSQAHKSTGSREGHRLADSSPLQAVRIADAPRRLDLCRAAILQRDFAALAAIAELDSNWLHAVTMTCSPPLLYWQPATLEVMQSVAAWRASGIPAFYTIDAGPNVHVLCQGEYASQVADLLKEIPGVAEVRCAGIGGPARLLAAG
jgi:diphosphomevalonate decarboxylase